MTNISKSTATPAITKTQFVSGQTIDAADFTSAFAEVDTNFDEAQKLVQVSDTDTNVKDLNSALVVSGLITKTVLNSGGNEQIEFGLAEPLTIGDGTTSALLTLNSAVGAWSYISGRKASERRWEMFLGNSTAETGGNAGSNFVLRSFDDNDVLIRNDIVINRASGLITFGGEVRVEGNLTVQGTLDHNGTAIGFYGTTPVGQLSVTGSRGGNAALASLLTALDSLGLVIDSSSA